MDKNTLSNYGWIVIAVLVLSVMIALATPFGEYIKAGVESTTAGLFDTSEKAMNIVGMSGKTPDSEKATAKGSYIAVNDVAPTQHNLKVNLSSDTITDFSGVSISRYGSNLLDMSKLLNHNLVDNGDGTYTFTRTSLGTSGIYTNYQDIFIPQGTPLYMSLTFIENNLSQKSFYAAFKFEDGTKELISIYNSSNTLVNGKVFDKNIVGIAMMCTETVNLVGDTFIFSKPQLNVGQKQEYQNYIDVQTVTAQTDGTVTGLTSVAPNMTIISNNSDVKITCEYQKKN